MHKTKYKAFMRAVVIAALIIASFLSATGSSLAALPPSSDVIYRGIDVSYFQGDIDFTAVREAGIKLVYIRASAGEDFLDPRFDENYAKARAAGLLIGAYHSMSAYTLEEAQAQARFFLDNIRGKSFDALLAMDYSYNHNLTQAQVNENALAFLNTLMDESDRGAVIYTDASGAIDVWSQEIAKLVPLWVAQYGVEEPEENGKWDYYVGFQYSDTGRVPGIEGNVDLDRFTNGILLEDSSAIPGERPVPTQPETKLITVTVERGDTLFKLAREYDTSVASIVRLNDIRNPNLIFIGERLYIRTDYTNPESEVKTYTIKRGDTLWSIARRFDTTVSRLAAINGIRNPNLIYAGETIRLS